MSKRFCIVDFPKSCIKADSSAAYRDATDDTRPDYMADSCWSALCAELKEEILEVLHEKQDNARSSKIQ